MLPGNTSSTLVGNYIRAQQSVIDTVRISPDDLRLTVGEKVQAVVTNQLNNGRFAVLIKDQLLDLNLPRNTQPGDQFELTVLSKEPQLTFRLNPNLSPTNLPQALSTESISKDANVALSKGATLIGELLKQDEKTASASTLQQSQPLFAGKPDPAQLASQLAGRLAQSGLFYESHQAEWATGQRTLQTLLSEPQALIHGNKASSLPAGTASMTSSKTELAATPMPQMRNYDVSDTNTNSVISNTNANQMAQNAAKLAVDSQLQNASTSQILDEQGLHQIVRQQIDLLENKPLIWQGQAWPGQALRWELETDVDRDANAENEHVQQQWQTRLNLDLPKLGSIGVLAQLQDGQFKLRFQAGSEATLQLLREQQPELMRRFDAAGLKLVASRVESDEH
ncbi:flagellar hook-length control protein FliK [Chitinibacter bivalviorum]|uniref:Flagellar hook-length control protein FliK n=1 Tax=Chitinibacter bivalviorum TaxID=2739434 RepID=A0A7H9BFC1_9NEIS|nr:flagellar hook-length control protein FliK [Chitinibacter bivalviorum]QLG87403.1 flagellar hook-length control protein FliK [Chitinibacter bivalviorum]